MSSATAFSLVSCALTAPSGRLCQSHPNVSRSNLAALAAGAYDDEHLDGAQMYDNLTTTNSQSDTTIHHWRWRRDKSDRSEKDRGLSGARDVPIKTEQLLAIDKKLPQLRLHHRLSVESSASTLATLAYVEEVSISSVIYVLVERRPLLITQSALNMPDPSIVYVPKLEQIPLDCRCCSYINISYVM